MLFVDLFCQFVVTGLFSQKWFVAVTGFLAMPLSVLFWTQSHAGSVVFEQHGLTPLVMSFVTYPGSFGVIGCAFLLSVLVREAARDFHHWLLDVCEKGNV